MSNLVQVGSYAEYRSAILMQEDGQFWIDMLEQEHKDLDGMLHLMPAGTCTNSEINHIEVVGQGDVDVAETFVGDGRVIMNIRKQPIYRYNGLLYSEPFK